MDLNGPDTLAVPFRCHLSRPLPCHFLSGVSLRMKKVWKEMNAILDGVIDDQNVRRGAAGEDGKESLIEIC